MVRPYNRSATGINSMLIKTLCLAEPPAGASAAIDAAADAAAQQLPGLRQLVVQRVLRHIPTDYMDNDRPYNGVSAEADRIGMILAFEFADARAAALASGAAAWARLTTALRALSPVLFMLDTVPNIPVPLHGGALDGGFRRWLLLTRKAGTPEAFREGWFGRHASLVRALPQLDGYVQGLVSARYDAAGAPVDYAAMPIDGIAEVCFADEAAMNASYACDARLPLRDDGRELMARVSTLLVQGRAHRAQQAAGDAAASRGQA
jgi:EthD domain